MTATQAPVLRREQVRRLDALGHAASQRLRAASFCVVLSGWLLIALTRFERMPFLAAVKEAKMRTFVTPGELLTIEAAVVHEGSGFTITEAKVSVGGKTKCNATLTFRQVPFPNDDLRGHMETMAKRIGFPQQMFAHG